MSSSTSCWWPFSLLGSRSMTDPERDCPRSLCESARFMPFASGTNKPPQGTFNQNRTDVPGGISWTELRWSVIEFAEKMDDGELIRNDQMFWRTKKVGWFPRLVTASESWTTQQLSSSIDGCKLILRGAKHYWKQRSDCFKEKPTKFHSNFLKQLLIATGHHS